MGISELMWFLLGVFTVLIAEVALLAVAVWRRMNKK